MPAQARTTRGCALSSRFTYPSYLGLHADELDARAVRAVAMLADCRACPRDCRVNRLEDRWAACKTGRYALVSSWFPHFGEEYCLRGWNGSGTIFFTHCNLRCVFCQNYDISQDVRPPYRTGTSGSLEQPGVPPHDLARMMLELQARGCPAGKVGRASYAEINRRLTSAEFREAHRIAADLGLRRIDERRPHARLLRRMV